MAEPAEVPFEVLKQLCDALHGFKVALDDCVIQENFLLVADTHVEPAKNVRITVRTSDDSVDEFTVRFESESTKE